MLAKMTHLPTRTVVQYSITNLKYEFEHCSRKVRPDLGLKNPGHLHGDDVFNWDERNQDLNNIRFSAPDKWRHIRCGHSAETYAESLIWMTAKARLLGFARRIAWSKRTKSTSRLYRC